LSSPAVALAVSKLSATDAVPSAGGDMFLSRPSSRVFNVGLFHPGRFLVGSVLTQGQPVDRARFVVRETDLRVNHPQEERVFLFREDFEARLIGNLLEEPLAFSLDRDGEGGRELILPNLGSERFLR
jgi:hypothetical protein